MEPLYSSLIPFLNIRYVIHNFLYTVWAVVFAKSVITSALILFISSLFSMLLYSTHILYQTKTSANEKRRPYSLHYKILKVPFPIILIIYRQSNINQIAFQGNTINSFHIAICAFSFHIQPLYLYYNLSYIYHYRQALAWR